MRAGRSKEPGHLQLMPFHPVRYADAVGKRAGNASSAARASEGGQPRACARPIESVGGCARALSPVPWGRANQPLMQICTGGGGERRGKYIWFIYNSMEKWGGFSVILFLHVGDR